LDKTVRIWDPILGQTISILEKYSNWIWSIVWSPDRNRFVSEFLDKTVRIWDPATGQSISILREYSNSVKSVVWSPDRNRFVSVSDNYIVRIWNPAIGQTISIYEKYSSWIWSVVWFPDRNRLVSESFDKTVRIWNPATSQSISTLEKYRYYIRSIVWSPDRNRLVSVSDNNTVKIWDPATGRSISTLSIDFISSFEFDKNNLNLLNTNLGIYEIGSISPLAPILGDFILPLKQLEYRLSEGYSWIIFNGLKLLWLPSEYRPDDPNNFAIYASTLAIGCASGRVMFLALSQQNPISSL